MRGDTMLPKRNYYLNDYFDLFDGRYTKEKEYMKTDIYELNNKYIIEIDLPGIIKDNIKVTYDAGYLTIKISRNNINSNLNTYIRRERFYGILKRSFYIGIKKETDIKASYKNNILQISFPKEDLIEKSNKDISIL